MFLRYESFSGYLKGYPITSSILGINLIYFLIIYFSGATDANHLQGLVDLGAQVSGPTPEYQEVWRYISSMFMHSNMQHFLFNSFSIFIFAPALEKILGMASYIVFYIVSGITGGLASELVYGIIKNDINVVSVGASGAIYGVYAGLIYLSIFQPQYIDARSKQTIWIIFGIGIVYSLFPGINLYAHLGGFIGGFVVMYVLHQLKQAKNKR